MVPRFVLKDTCINVRAHEKKDHATVDTLVQQDLIGRASKQKYSRKAIQMQKRLQRLCNDKLEGREIISEFLGVIGHNICITRIIQ